MSQSQQHPPWSCFYSFSYGNPTSFSFFDIEGRNRHTVGVVLGVETCRLDSGKCNQDLERNTSIRRAASIDKKSSMAESIAESNNTGLVWACVQMNWKV